LAHYAKKENLRSVPQQNRDHWPEIYPAPINEISETKKEETEQIFLDDILESKGSEPVIYARQTVEQSADKDLLNN
jgi:hypothetical protein